MKVKEQIIEDDYSIYNADCMDVISDLPCESIDLSVYSPPFAGLYKYSSSERDFSNCENKEQFLNQYEFLIKEISRVTKPGRITAVHCTDIFDNTCRLWDFPHEIIKLQEKGYQYFRGDATSDETLEAVGVKYAKGIVVTLGTEQDNLFGTMSVRTRNQKALLLSRCSHEDTELKLKRAGANKVVNPYVAGGHKMTELLIEPSIEDTVSISTPQFDIDLVVEEIEINNVPSLIGVKILDSNIRKKYNIIINVNKHRKYIYNI